MTTSLFEYISKDQARARVSRFASSQGQSEEFHVCVEAAPSGDFDEQLTAVEAFYGQVLAEFGLNDESAVLRRVFLSDVANQHALLERSRFAASAGSQSMAVSVVEQPPLEGRRICIWEYHVRSQSQLNKRRVSHGVAFDRNGLSHIWSSGLKASGGNALEQTASLLNGYDNALALEGATVRDHAVRTWFFVSDIDAEYAALVDARKSHFNNIGLTAETHYISSTGIAGRSLSPKDRVQLDAYAIGGLAREQVKFLTAPQYLGPTHLYGVTFERGTRIAYGDRSHVYISGTASIDPAGTTLHVGDIGKQCQRALENTEALLRDAEASLSDVVQLIAYVRDPADGGQVIEFLDRHCGKLPRIVVRAAVCRPSWLVEFECIALRAQSRAGFPEF